MILFKMPKTINFWLPAAIAAGGAILGGLLSASSGERASDKNIANANYQAELDRQYSKEFAQHGVSWKAADARRAGIDPVAAMGSTTLYSPAGKAVNTQGQDYSFIGDAAKHVGNAVERNKPATEAEKLQLESAHLDNDYKQIRNMAAQKDLMNTQTQNPVNSTQNGVIEGVGTSKEDVIEETPPRILNRSSNSPAHSAGVNPSQMYMTGPNDELLSVNEEKLGEALDSDLMGNVELQGTKIVKSVKDTAMGLKYPKFKPWQVSKQYPKHYVWHKKRNWFGHTRWVAGPPHKRAQNMKKKAPWWRGTHIYKPYK